MYIITTNGMNAPTDTPAQSHSAATMSKTAAENVRPIPKMETTRITTAIAGIRGPWIATAAAQPTTAPLAQQLPRDDSRGR